MVSVVGVSGCGAHCDMLGAATGRLAVSVSDETRFPEEQGEGRLSWFSVDRGQVGT